MFYYFSPSALTFGQLEDTSFPIRGFRGARKPCSDGSRYTHAKKQCLPTEVKFKV